MKFITTVLAISSLLPLIRGQIFAFEFPDCAAGCPAEICGSEPTLDCICDDPSGMGSCIGSNCREGTEPQYAGALYAAGCGTFMRESS
jgi:hypothetical protein